MKTPINKIDALVFDLIGLLLPSAEDAARAATQGRPLPWGGTGFLALLAGRFLFGDGPEHTFVGDLPLVGYHREPRRVSRNKNPIVRLVHIRRRAPELLIGENGEESQRDDRQCRDELARKGDQNLP